MTGINTLENPGAKNEPPKKRGRPKGSGKKQIQDKGNLASVPGSHGTKGKLTSIPLSREQAHTISTMLGMQSFDTALRLFVDAMKKMTLKGYDHNLDFPEGFDQLFTKQLQFSAEKQMLSEDLYKYIVKYGKKMLPTLERMKRMYAHREYPLETILIEKLYEMLSKVPVTVQFADIPDETAKVLTNNMEMDAKRVAATSIKNFLQEVEESIGPEIYTYNQQGEKTILLTQKDIEMLYRTAVDKLGKRIRYKNNMQPNTAISDRKLVEFFAWYMGENPNGSQVVDWKTVLPQLYVKTGKRVPAYTQKRQAPTLVKHKTPQEHIAELPALGFEGIEVGKTYQGKRIDNSVLTMGHNEFYPLYISSFSGTPGEGIFVPIPKHYYPVDGKIGDFYPIKITEKNKNNRKDAYARKEYLLKGHLLAENDES